MLFSGTGLQNSIILAAIGTKALAINARIYQKIEIGTVIRQHLLFANRYRNRTLCDQCNNQPR